MRIPIVNEQDEIITYKEREETTSEDIRRIVVLYVFNQNKEILIAKRQSIKRIHPNLWGSSVAGTVDEGYDYDTTVKKEAEEEINLTNIRPIFFKKIFYQTPRNRRFSCIYYVNINSSNVNLVMQKEEVAEIKWVNLLDLENWFKNKPEDFVPSFSILLDSIKEIYANQS